MSGYPAFKDPFSGFVKLADGQYWHKPVPAQQNGGPASSDTMGQPDLIIFCAWAFAAPKHAIKYIVQYQLLYPQAHILALQSNRLGDFAWTPNKLQIERLEPAVEAIRNLLETYPLNDYKELGLGEKKMRNPTILLHLLSNGGALSAVQLAQAYRENVAIFPPSSPHSTYERRIPPPELPISAMILDSAPGRPDFIAGVRVAVLSIPASAPYLRALFTPLAYLLVAGIKAADMIGFENSVARLWRHLNETTGPFLLNRTVWDSAERNTTIKGETKLTSTPTPTLVPRTYIYSTRDEMVDWASVHEHAATAREHLAAVAADTIGRPTHAELADLIRLEQYKDSAHVNHMSADPTKYWSIVRETFERSLQ